MPLDFIIDFTDELQVSEYLGALDSKKHPLRHENYAENIVHAKEMAVHFMGTLPKDLIESYRPNEPQNIKDYRLDSYEPTTKSNADKVTNTLSKIQKSGNSSINFPAETVSSIGDDTLENYLKNYPIYGTLSNWVFGPAMENMVIDPNAVAVFLPSRQSEDDTDFNEPVGRIYDSIMVVDKWEGHYYTILLDHHRPIEKNGQTVNEGNVYLFIDKNSLVKAIQVSETPDGERIYEIEILQITDFPRVTAFELKGDIIPSSFPLAYESYTSGVLPYLNKVIRMTSDLEAQFVQQIYLVMVENKVD